MCKMCEWRQETGSEASAQAKYEQWEAEQMKKHGWVMHYVPDGKTLNAHTHGLEAFGHRDLQIVFPLPMDTAHQLLAIAAERVKDGEKFEPGRPVSKIAGGGYDVMFVAAREADRDVLRMILPDKAGRLERDSITDGFEIQYADIEEEWSSEIVVV